MSQQDEWRDEDDGPDRGPDVPMTPIQAFFARMRTWAAQAREVPWHPECRWCDDTGWSTHVCPADPCDRKADSLCKRVAGYAHTYVRPCPCRPTNKTYQWHHSPPNTEDAEDVIGQVVSSRKTRR